VYFGLNGYLSDLCQLVDADCAYDKCYTYVDYAYTKYMFVCMML